MIEYIIFPLLVILAVAIQVKVVTSVDFRDFGLFEWIVFVTTYLLLNVLIVVGVFQIYFDTYFL